MYEEEQPPFMPAHPGYVALYIENGALHMNSIVGWERYSRPWPVTLREGPGADAIVFPDGHVESTFDGQRWGSLAAFCRACRLKIPKEI